MSEEEKDREIAELKEKNEELRNHLEAAATAKEYLDDAEDLLSQAQGVVIKARDILKNF